MKDFGKEALDFLKDIIIIVLIVLVVRTFFMMPFKINGQSMYESYYDKEFIIVDRFSYRDFPVLWQHRQIQRGDVVIFKPGVSEERKYYIKRVIGLPGETLKIEDGRVYLLNPGTEKYEEIEEGGYLLEKNNKNTSVNGSSEASIYEIPKGGYFVMWDNRTQSTDSRTCFNKCSLRTNYMTSQEVVGRVLVDLWYFNFKDFSFTHPTLGISTKPKFFSTLDDYEYTWIDFSS